MRYNETTGDCDVVTEVKRGRVVMALKELEEQVSILEASVSSLQSKIEPVLLKGLGNGEAKPLAQPPTPLESQIALQIREAVERVTRLRRQVDSLTQQAEL